MDETEQEVIELVNRLRQRHRLTALKPEDHLAAAARCHAADMAQYRYFSHTGRDGYGVLSRVRRTGYIPERSGFSLAENIAFGSRDASEAVEGWYASPGHRVNLLGEGFVETGVAQAIDQDRMRYWVQVFGCRI